MDARRLSYPNGKIYRYYTVRIANEGTDFASHGCAINADNLFESPLPNERRRSNRIALLLSPWTIENYSERFDWFERRAEMKANPIILIVDDEQDSTSSLQARLVAKAYEVCIATDKTQAQEKAWAQRPGLVLLGTITPRGSAFELHEWLRHTPPFNDVPIVVIDAAPEEQLLKGWSREEGLQLESEDYLTKPVEPTSLVHLIGKLLGKVTRKIKVLVVDDHAIVRDGIRALLGVQKDMQVVGEAVDGKEALEKARRLSPDVVLMDIVMPVMNGLEATKRIRKECEHTKVLLLSQYDDEENALVSRQAGAYGFIPKRSASTQLLAAIRSMS